MNAKNSLLLCILVLIFLHASDTTAHETGGSVVEKFDEFKQTSKAKCDRLNKILCVNSNISRSKQIEKSKKTNIKKVSTANKKTTTTDNRKKPNTTNNAAKKSSLQKKVIPKLRDIPLPERQKFVKEILEQHNKYRKDHGVGSLRLDSEISKFSQKYAEKLAKTGNVRTSPEESRPQGCGENLYGQVRYPARAEIVTRFWYDTRTVNYDYNKEPQTTTSANFSQLIWKGSSKLGVGLASTTAGITIIACHYQPGGNVEGEFRQNVLAPKKNENVILDKNKNKIQYKVANNQKKGNNNGKKRAHPE